MRQIIAHLAAESLQVAVALGLRLIQGVVRICRAQVRPTAELIDVRRYQFSKEVDLCIRKAFGVRYKVVKAQVSSHLH